MATVENPAQSSDVIDRAVVALHDGMPATDGAGVRMTRMIGTPQLDHIDPFLLFDVFQTDRPDDYIAGFPPHPHRGFETVTYMLAGKMRHKDSAGHEGVIETGGIQWMTAGRGIIHSEMPEQQDGLMWGTQLWINLPAADKMTDPSYRECGRSEIPVEDRAGGASVKVIAGTTAGGTVGAVTGRPTEPRYFDVSLAGGGRFDEGIPETHNCFLFVVEGEISVGASEESPVAHAGQLAILGTGSSITVRGNAAGNRFLLIAGREIGEPIARGGPFVMNTRAEILQAMHDYRSGNF